jgi:uncharacterized UBP type Zn finger protein
LQADELLQPEEPSDDVNSDLLQQLVAMGFDASQSKNALLSTGNSGTIAWTVIFFAMC